MRSNFLKIVLLTVICLVNLRGNSSLAGERNCTMTVKTAEVANDLLPELDEQEATSVFYRVLNF